MQQAKIPTSLSNDNRNLFI